MCFCNKCYKVSGSIFLGLGVLLLLQDRGIWDIWGINWYTLLFLAAGLGMFASSTCKDCQALRMPKK